MYIGTVRLCYDGNYLGYFEYLLMRRHNYNTSHMDSSRERERKGMYCGFYFVFLGVRLLSYCNPLKVSLTSYIYALAIHPFHGCKNTIN